MQATTTESSKSASPGRRPTYPYAEWVADSSWKTIRRGIDWPAERSAHSMAVSLYQYGTRHGFRVETSAVDGDQALRFRFTPKAEPPPADFDYDADADPVSTHIELIKLNADLKLRLAGVELIGLAQHHGASKAGLTAMIAALKKALGQ